MLGLNTWDLCLDVHGNMAVATDPYAPAQDVSSACRVFQGEQWYDNTLGIPYFQQILGLVPPGSLIKAYLVNTALTVPEITTAVCIFTSFVRRRLSGQLQLTLSSGQQAIIAFGEVFGPLPWYAPGASPEASSSPSGGP